MDTKVNQIPVYFSTILICIGIYLIGYHIPRYNFPLLISLFSFAFFGLFILQKSNITEKKLFALGIFLRVLLIFSVPILSDDYFRFLWDGLLIKNGFNPFEYKPSELIGQFQNSNIHNKLYSGMNSQHYYSNYPPINQWFFFFSALSDSVLGGIITLRFFIIGFEIGTYFIIKKILNRYSLNLNRIWWYWLNPLVILELTGNLHGEGILIFFLLLALYNFSKLKDFNGGLFLGLSVLSKPFSLIFFPILLLKSRRYRSKNLLLGAIPLIIIAFLPFLNWSNFNHFLQNLDLYFPSFEFNGSVFNVLKWVGYQVFNFDIITIAGPALSIISFLLIILISWLFRFRNRLVIFKALTIIFCIYLFLSPIVHPWYCILPLTLSLFTNMKFMIAWSATIFLSYGMYASDLNYNIKNSLLFIEYLIVFVILFQDLKGSFSIQKIKTGIRI